MKTVSPALNLPQIDQEIIGFWRADNTFEKSLAARADAPEYLFYDGPPFASGLPHYGHLLVGTVKDIIPRYQTMLGKHVERRFGWDVHGLPIEMIIEKELGLKGRTDILEYGVDRYNEACRAGVLRYVEQWETTTERIGRWVDFRNDYKTMDTDFMESVWWAFKQLWDKGLIYEGTRAMPYSWRLSTPLSNFEAGSNYQMVRDKTATASFELDDPDFLQKYNLTGQSISFLAWTTTPWTLPANMALCLGPKILYNLVNVEGSSADQHAQNYIVAADLAASVLAGKKFTVIRSFTGAELEKVRYKPLFNYYQSESERAFYTVTDPFVTTEDGTGIVHIAPAHGEDDHRIGLAHDLPVLEPTDAEGNFTSMATDFAGQNIKAAEPAILQFLKDADLLFAQGIIDHTFPHCERSNTPLMYKAIPAWYIKVEQQQAEMSANNQQITWVPEHIKDGRFGNWLGQARDWNISRNRFWGNPLPIWRCQAKACAHITCIGSIAELSAASGRPEDSITDLHKHYVDEIKWQCPQCKQAQMERIPEVLDCWFESGSMPYAQQHYPFENEQKFNQSFPADFIIESLDQTRGWFYTLTVLSTAIFGRPAFENCIVTGMVLAADGKKMSKSLQNYPDPTYLLDQYGGDALRLYLVNSPLVRGESLRFKEDGVKSTVKEVFLPFWNAYSFFTNYAQADNYQPDAKLTDSESLLDRWIISTLQTLLSEVEAEMSAYRIYNVVPRLLSFLEDLTNWYLRRSRRRFWADENPDKQAGYNTFYYILLELSKTLAPFLPFMAESIYLNLRSLQSEEKISVHLQDYPVLNPALQDSALEQQVTLIQQTVSLGRALRARLKIKTRQPLQKIVVVTQDESAAETLKRFASDLYEELNVKNVEFSRNEGDLVKLSIKPDFKKLGPVFGKEMKNLAAVLGKLGESEIKAIEAGEDFLFNDKTVATADLQIIRQAKDSALEIETADGVTVFYDLEISPDLKSEGLAREVVNRIQKMRKEADFKLSDRVRVALLVDPELAAAIQAHHDYISEETLCTDLQTYNTEIDAKDSFEYQDATEIESNPVQIALQRV